MGIIGNGYYNMDQPQNEQELTIKRRKVIVASALGALVSELFADDCTTHLSLLLHELIEENESSNDFQMSILQFYNQGHPNIDRFETFGTVAVGVKDFVFKTIPAYSEIEFQQHFRMTRDCFQKLLTTLKPYFFLREHPSHVSVDYKLYLTIWTLGNQESFRQIADRFDVSKGTAYLFFKQGCNAIIQLREKYIKWPKDEEEKMSISKGFKFPNSYGAIDGSHIQIKAPLEHLADYTNRKMFTSVNLQAICDSNMRFIDISVGWPGSMHDARIFKLSSVFIKLEKEESRFHILGDSAYPLSKTLMVPYRDNGHLTQIEMNYNSQHSSSRTVIERAFARLKGKFRRLKYLDMSQLPFVTEVITVACVLHNFILLSNVVDDEDFENDESPLISREYEVNYNDNNYLDNNGKIKRDLIAAML